MSLALNNQALARIITCILKNASEAVPGIRGVHAEAGTVDMLFGHWSATCSLSCFVF